MNIGIQLYSLRSEIASLGVEAVFSEIAKAGYDSVEFAGFYGLSPVEMKNLLDKYGLKGLSAHIGLFDVIKHLEYIDVIGIKSVYIPGIDHDYMRNKTEEMAKEIALVQKELLPRGVRFGYHNHAHEYANGEDTVWKLLNLTTDFYAQIDVCWVKAAGVEPTDKMRQYGERLGCLHIKELKEASVEGARLPAPVIGEGAVGMKDVLALAKQMNIDTFIMEVEGMECPYEEYLKRSYDNIVKYLS